ncbi:uncharacterized protein LOC126904785 [Daktulosphaira vitifoliae]|uniref:uncharacterized protein LOC126904785 n=1 Tax=Daktulosphaira vitifoliae TaxID=58002 RepID=UPI0021A9B23B|nr:uncharacterized protein LOC126904785 [Daktulosphaira vitifoliae]
MSNLNVFVFYSTFLFLILNLTNCNVVKKFSDISDMDDEEQSNVTNNLSVTSPPARQVEHHASSNIKCTDRNTGKRYNIGVSWYSDGCGKSTCTLTDESHSLVVTENCYCKTCPKGMHCSVVRRASSNISQYPDCCPTTICLPDQPSQYLWKKFGTWRHWIHL